MFSPVAWCFHDAFSWVDLGKRWYSRWSTRSRWLQRIFFNHDFSLPRVLVQGVYFVGPRGKYEHIIGREFPVEFEIVDRRPGANQINRYQVTNKCGINCSLRRMNFITSCAAVVQWLVSESRQNEMSLGSVQQHVWMALQRDLAGSLNPVHMYDDCSNRRASSFVLRHVWPWSSSTTTKLHLVHVNSDMSYFRLYPE